MTLQTGLTERSTESSSVNEARRHWESSTVHHLFRKQPDTLSVWAVTNCSFHGNCKNHFSFSSSACGVVVWSTRTTTNHPLRKRAWTLEPYKKRAKKAKNTRLHAGGDLALRRGM